VFEAHRLGIYAHVFAASAALLIGPWQFLSSIRLMRPRLHRVLGWVYLVVGVGVGGLSGLYMSVFAFGGVISKAGFGLLAVIWLYTGVRALLAARAHQFAVHRRWMVRNFGLSLSAVTLRIGLGIGFGLQLPFEVFYPCLAWLAWVPNLLIAEYLIRRSMQSRPDTASGPLPSEQ
ncbi:MAG: DUF2306 domain-containing protein, partial [Gemmataceae bacterium]